VTYMIFSTLAKLVVLF